MGSFLNYIRGFLNIQQEFLLNLQNLDILHHLLKNIIIIKIGSLIKEYIYF